MLNSKRLIRINIIVIALYVVVQLLPIHSILWSVSRSSIELIATIFAPSLLLTLLCAAMYKRLTQWETLALSGITALCIIPAILWVELIVWPHPFMYLPILNALIIFIAYILISPFAPKADIPNENWPLLFSAAAYLLLTVSIVSLYPFFSESDSYHWALIYKNIISSAHSVSVPGDRPLFFVLYYLLNQITHIATYNIFKYAIPFFSLLVLPPAWLVARRSPNKMAQLAILLSPLLSPALIISTQASIPQTIALITSFYFLYFLLYAQITKQMFFYYVAGLIAGLAYFYHESSIFLICAWIFVTIVFFRKHIMRWLVANPLSSLLAILIVITNIGRLRSVIEVLSFWIIRTVTNFIPHLNFLYPAHYTNIDGYSVGWGNLAGVAKFYAYYAGPTVLFLVFITIALILRDKFFRKQSYDALRSSPPSYLVLLVSFLPYFCFAEVFPRIFNFALLPDREWLFVALISSALLVLVAQYKSKRENVIYGITLICLMVSVGGATFINYQKKFIATDLQLNSIKWIGQNIPAGQLIITNDNTDLLKFYTNAEVTSAQSDYYCNTNVADLGLLEKSDPQAAYYLSLQYVTDLEKQLAKSIPSNPSNLRDLLDQTIARINDDEKSRILDGLSASKRSVFIYFNQQDPNNPLLQRPYIQNRLAMPCSQPTFDQYPNLYKKVFDNGQIKIWKMLNKN